MDLWHCIDFAKFIQLHTKRNQNILKLVKVKKKLTHTMIHLNVSILIAPIINIADEAGRYLWAK